MMRREDGGGDDDFVTKTNKSRKKGHRAAGNADDKDTAGDAATPTPATAAATTTTTSGGASASTAAAVPAAPASSEGISLRPRTMFTVKGRGRTESEGSPAYRPQWSKDGEGFVSNTPNTDNTTEGRDGTRRKGKVLRYTKEELLGMHFTTTTAPKFPADTQVASEHSLPPVSTLPFDYEEIYKQWALNRNRGRGRGRSTTGQSAEGGGSTSERSRSNGKWDDSGDKWDGKSKRGGDRSNRDGDGKWDRGGNDGDSKAQGDDIWDDVGIGGGDANEFDLSSMAAAAEKFRREMDAMRDQERPKEVEVPDVTDMDEFDKKLEDAAAAGQFEDSDDEAPWDMPTTTTKDDTSKEDNASLLFQSTFDHTVPAVEDKPLHLEEQSFSLSSLASSTFGLAPPAPVEVRDEWFYLDPQGIQQGPFKTAEMREWFEAGYFKPHLPIRFGRDGSFTPLANQFIPGEMPFASIPRPSPKVDLRAREQQRLMELHQQQQQQMLQLQQQQEQQRILQFNQEEKIRLEMQRLEIARQQQNHMYQQQQQLIHQQQQQQQQQQMLLQQQSSWQRSQREGIMSALGMFGGGEVKDAFASGGAPMQFQNDFGSNHQFDALNVDQLQGQVFNQPPRNRLDDPWNPSSSRTPFADSAAQSISQTGLFAPQDVPLQRSEAASLPKPAEEILGAWGKPVESTGPVPAQTNEQNTAPLPSSPKSVKQSKTPESSPSTERSPQKQKAKNRSPSKPKPRTNEQQSKKDNAWASAPASKPISKSLKDIQDEEQRELRKNLEEQGDSVDLAQMGAQLKMMLGVNVATSTRSTPAQVVTPPAPAPTPTPTPKPTPSPATASPWGKAVVAPQATQSSKSMREILAEEERLAAERAKKSESTSTGSHWMNVVAGNTVAPSVPKASRLGPVPASVLKSSTRQGRGSVSSEANRTPSATPGKAESDASFWNFGAAGQSTKPVSSSDGNGASNFGSGRLSSEFMGWCAKQIKAINGSDDLTLVEYCATLEDPGEIREYLAAYLGSTPRVSAFATEFIQRKKSAPVSKKAAASSEGLDAEAKKGKRRTKGQKIDPSLLNYSVGS